MVNGVQIISIQITDARPRNFSLDLSPKVLELPKTKGRFIISIGSITLLLW